MYYLSNVSDTGVSEKVSFFIRFIWSLFSHSKERIKSRISHELLFIIELIISALLQGIEAWGRCHSRL